MNSRHDVERSGNLEWDRLIRDRTPARLRVGRAGGAYRTATQLQLRADHAAARDAVSRELDLQHDLGLAFIERWRLFEVRTRARSKLEYLLQPPLGRDFDDSARREILSHCPQAPDLQIAIGDGLSASAIAVQVPELVPLLVTEAERRSWTVGQMFVVRHCRVGVMNVIGEWLRPRVVVLLIGERPGLSASDSLSAYMGYMPTRAHTDADRNLVCNIHSRGIPIDAAAIRIVRFAAELMRLQRSGTSIKETAPGPNKPTLPRATPERSPGR